MPSFPLRVSCLGMLLFFLSSFAGAEHPLDRLHPVAIFSFDQPPDSPRLTDGAGRLTAKIAKPEKGLPKLLDGARPYLGKAWEFDGAGACLAMELPRDAALGNIQKAKGASIAFWIKAAWRGEYSNLRVLGAGGLADVQMSKGRGKGDLSCILGDNNIHCNQNTGAVLFDGNWHLVVIAADFASVPDNVCYYVDGKVDSKSSAIFQRDMPVKEVVLGARTNKAMGFHGALDDFAIFDYTLTAEQVAGIYAGPVYAGQERELFLPAALELAGKAPSGAEVVWSKKSGPGEVGFANSRQSDTKATFSAPGIYILNYQVSGFPAQELKVTARSEAPPRVLAGDPLYLPPTSNTARLSARVTLPGQAGLEGVSLAWSKADGPGDVKFSDPAALDTTAIFSKEGLYRLSLSARKGTLEGRGEISVLHETPLSRHYALLLGPLYLLDFGAPASRESAGVADLAGNTCAELKKAGDILPDQVPGARPFTGYAWDFSKTSASVGVHNRFNVARLGNPEFTKGMAFSVWLKSNRRDGDYGVIGGAGYGGIFKIQPKKYGRGETGLSVSSGVTDLISTGLISGKSRDLFDGKWHHVAFSADFTAPADNVRLYVDGTLNARETRRFSENMADIRTDHYHVWGAMPNGGNPPVFAGQMDDAMVFDRPLNGEEVAYLFNGPNDTQAALLSRPPLRVDPGKDQVLPMPARNIRLTATVEPAGQARGRWELVSGPGAVSFEQPGQFSTEVTFGPLGPVHNPNYLEYVFRFRAEEGDRVAKLRGQGETSVVFYASNAPVTRAFSKTPPVGAHPRVLFAQEDLPEMKERCKTIPVAKKALQLLRERNAKSLFNPSSPAGSVYQALRENRPNVNVTAAVGDGVKDVYEYTDGGGDMYGRLCGAAFAALMDEDISRGLELAEVTSRCAREHLKVYRPAYEAALTHDASGALGLAYDFLFNFMNEEQRQPVRQLLSRMTRWRQSMGTGMSAPDCSTNWRTFHDHIVIASLAIEGEEGYDPAVYEQNVHKLRTFLSQYGIFPSGLGHEGWGYFGFGMRSGALSALATARRGENLFQTTNLYPAMLAMFRYMPPGLNCLVSHDDCPGGLVNVPNNLIWVGGYVWPQNPAATYLSARLAGNALSLDNQPNLGMMGALFAPRPLSGAETQEKAAAALKLPRNLFCPDTGCLDMRTDWSADALQLRFRCRMDKYYLGHMHPDINSFEFYALGREWFTDPGKSEWPNDFHQTVLIDGVGGGGSSAALTWPSLPGKFLEMRDTPDMTLGAGDGKVFYSFVPMKRTSGAREDIGQKFVTPDLLWADFVYGKTRNDTMPAWRAQPLYAGQFSQKGLFEYNPVRRAFRSCALIRGKHPFVLIVDDIQKDDVPREYTWVANMRAGTIEPVNSKENEIFVKQKKDPENGPMLLLRALQPSGKFATPAFSESKLPNSEKSDAAVTQIRIKAGNTNAPDFKVLLYPFRLGAPIPLTEWNKDKSKLTVTTGEEKRVLVFSRMEDGRTKIALDEEK